jgi:transposase
MTLTKVTLRELTVEERQALEHLGSSRTAQARFVERAQILLALAEGRRPSQVAQDFGVCRPTVYLGIPRFNEQGLRGLEDRPRSGRPHTSTAQQRAEVSATALTNPQSLGLPLGCWTRDRLQAYLNEQKGIPIKRSRIDEILLEEGLKWRHQETWFGERVDPDFAERSDCLQSQGPRAVHSRKWRAEDQRAIANSGFQGRPVRMTALAITRSFRATAVRITLAFLPRAANRSRKAFSAGLCRTADSAAR